MNKQSKADFYLFLTTFIYGSTFVIFKFLLNNVSPILFLVFRYGFATFIFYLLFSKYLKSFSLETIKKGVILGLIVGVGILIQTIGVAYTTASKAAFITGMMVVFTPLSQIFILKKTPTISNVLGIFSVIIGFYFLTYPFESNINFGDILVLIASFLFGIYIVYLDLFTRGENSFQITFLQFITMAILYLICFPFETKYLNINFEFLWMMGFMIIFATIIAVYIQTHYQKDTTPTKAVLIFSIEPVVASILAYYTLNENIGYFGIIGGSMIIFGILISEFLENILKYFKLK